MYSFIWIKRLIDNDHVNNSNELSSVKLKLSNFLSFFAECVSGVFFFCVKIVLGRNVSYIEHVQ